MAKYICSNCGEVLSGNGQGAGCGSVFWSICLIFTILISVFVPVLWIVVLFEILFIILCSNSSDTICKCCKAKNTVIPINSTKGLKLYEEYRARFEEDEDDE